MCHVRQPDSVFVLFKTILQKKNKYGRKHNPYSYYIKTDLTEKRVKVFRLYYFK